MRSTLSFLSLVFLLVESPFEAWAQEYNTTCEESKQLATSLKLEFEEFKDLIFAKKTQIAFFPEDRICLRVNRDIWADLQEPAGTDKPDFRLEQKVQLNVTEISLVPVTEALESDTARAVATDLGPLLAKHRDKKSIFFITLKIKEPVVKPPQLYLGNKHPFAKTITYATMLEMIKSRNTKVIDVRDSLTRNLLKVNGTLRSSPQGHSLKGLFRRPLRPDELLNAGIFLPTPVGMADKKKDSIVVFGNSRGFESYNYVTLLHKRGYINLYWVANGVDEPMRMVPSALEARSDIPEIQGPELIQLMKKESSVVLIDTRKAKDFDKATIEGAKNFPYRIRYNAFKKPYYRPAQITEAGLRAQGEVFESHLFSLLKNKTYIIFDSSAADWRAIKLATVLRARGYKTRWYSGGFLDWKYRQSFDPAFRIEKGQKNNKLKGSGKLTPLARPERNQKKRGAPPPADTREPDEGED